MSSIEKWCASIRDEWFMGENAWRAHKRALDKYMSGTRWTKRQLVKLRSQKAPSFVPNKIK